MQAFVESAVGSNQKQLRQPQVLHLTDAVLALIVTSISCRLSQMKPRVNCTIRL